MKKIYLLAFYLVFVIKINAQIFAPEIKVRLIPNDYVGIGEPDPAAKLEIGGITSSETAIRFENGKFSMGGSSDFLIDAPGIHGGRFIIKSGGNVGIGEPDPTAKLEIADVNANQTAIRFEDGKFSMGGSSDFLIDAPGIHGGRFIIKSGGNVGIGEPDPTAKLEIADVNANQTAIRFENGKFSMGGSSDFLIDAPGIQGGRFVIKSNGKVGIGTNNPNYDLEVNGVIRATSFSAQSPPWADFVFDSDYNLMSIGKLEEFIMINKHLPDIPSEKYVKENGIDLVNINSKLLQKIEELTLYTIAQEKRIEELEKQNERIEELEKQNKEILELLKTSR